MVVEGVLAGVLLAGEGRSKEERRKNKSSKVPSFQWLKQGFLLADHASVGVGCFGFLVLGLLLLSCDRKRKKKEEEKEERRES